MFAVIRLWKLFAFAFDVALVRKEASELVEKSEEQRSWGLRADLGRHSDSCQILRSVLIQLLLKSDGFSFRAELGPPSGSGAAQ